MQSNLYYSWTLSAGRSPGGPWDRAPFVLLVEEAGGRVSDLEGRSRFDRPPVLATNGLIHDECIAAIQENESQ